MNVTVLRQKTNVSIIGVAFASYSILAIWDFSPYAKYMGHADLGQVTNVASLLTLLPFFLVGWGLMVTAMMLPSTITLTNSIRSKVVRFGKANSSTFLLALGFVGIWLVPGALFFVFDFGIHTLAATFLPLRENLWMLEVLPISIAGVYELTPIKKRSRLDCCYPNELVRKLRKKDTDGKSQVFRMGMSYGKSTIACSWALMLLMFALGLGNVLWLILFGVIMISEKLPTMLYQRTSFFLGMTLIGISLVLIAAQTGIL